MRRARAALLAGAGLAVLTGCSPEELPLVGVQLDARGVPQALLRSCDDQGRVRAPALYAMEPAVADQQYWPDDQWLAWKSTEPRPKAADFPLFAPPTEWAVTTHGPQSLEPDRVYRLGFADPEETYAYNATVTFDTARLAALEPGQVLTHGGVVSRADFDRLARKAC
ncbi:hypothetical protein ACIRBX_13040 [Kitasatospora sp. NPDC096147]|uniref:hypothetical protein n=1 Tax=Kitasatospora sp. NPDC096147 TaxID=3364093 RepID=UPI00382C7139